MREKMLPGDARRIFAALLLLVLCDSAIAGPEAPASEDLDLLPVAAVEAAPIPSLDSRTADTAKLPMDTPTVVVVASRRAKVATEIDASVAVVSARDIEERQASSVGEVFRAVPGVATEGGPRPNGEFINVRGLSGPRVLIVVDGARQNFLGGHRSSLLVDPELLKQVELLRGPASALWGSDAVGGVMVLSTKDASDILLPGQAIGGRLRTGFEGNNSEQLFSGIGAARFGDLDAVLNLSSRDAEHYERGNGENVPDSAFDTLSGLAKLSWVPGAGPHRYTLSYQSYEHDTVSPSNPATEVDENNPLIDRTNDASYLAARYGFAGDDRLRAANVTIYSDTLDIHEDRVDEPRADRTEFDTIGANSNLTVALANDLDAPLLTFGLDGFRDRSSAMRDGQPRPQFPDAERIMLGGFAQVEWPIGPVTVTPGWRYDRFEAKSRQDDSEDIDKSQASAKLGLLFKVTESLHVRASFNEAFRAPGLIEVYAAGQHFLGNNFVPNPDLKPERAQNLEAGLRWNSAGFADHHAFEFDASVYRNRVDDFIELTVEVEEQVGAPQCLPPAPAVGCVNRNDDGSPNPFAPPIFIGGSTTSRNLDQATLEGIELETGYSINALRLGMSYSMVNGEDDTSGNPLLTIPANRWRGTIEWRPAARASGTFFDSLGAELGYTHVFSQDEVPQIVDEDGNLQNVIPATGAYQLVDLSLTYAPAGEGRRWGLVAPRLTLGVDNLTDEDYRDHLNVLFSPGRNLRASLSMGF